MRWWEYVREKWRQLRAPVGLLAEVETLRGMNQMRLKRLDFGDQEARLRFEDPVGVWQSMGLWFLEQLDEAGAHNCMQLDIIACSGPHEGEGVRLTLERAQAKSPMEMRAEAVREVGRLRMRAQGLLDRIQKGRTMPAANVIARELGAMLTGPEFRLGDVPKWWQDRKPVPGRGRPKKTP